MWSFDVGLFEVLIRTPAFPSKDWGSYVICDRESQMIWSDSWGLLRCGSLRYLSHVSVSPAVDDRQSSPCVEKQHEAPTGKQGILLLNGVSFRHRKEGTPKNNE